MDSPDIISMLIVISSDGIRMLYLAKYQQGFMTRTLTLLQNASENVKMWCLWTGPAAQYLKI